jgi:Leucine-rich repeat (LRR) protein
VRNNRLVTLDENVGDLKRLEELIVAGNYLTTLPATLSKLGSLKILDFSKNDVEILPDTLGKLQGLQLLDYAGNKVEVIPMVMTAMESLSTFKASRNLISSLGPTNADFTDQSACALSHLHTITHLDLSENKLVALPQPLRALTALKTLDLRDNMFVDLSPAHAIFNLWENLSSLNLSGNRLHTLPANMRTCKHLESVDLSFNWFEKMPLGLCTLRNLKKLDVRKNFLLRLPADICMLTSLEELDASENGLKHVAPELRMLTNMVTLNLSKNALEYLPPSFGMAEEVLGKLSNLRLLDVSNNLLPIIPLDIIKCSSLTDLHIYGNILKHPALHRAQIPCFGSLSVYIEEVSEIVYLNKMNQVARLFGNPMCTVGLEDGKSGTEQQLQVTTCKAATNNPFFQQSFPFVIRDCYQTVACKLNTKPLDAHRMVDQSAPMTPLRGLQVRLPVLVSVLYQQPMLNFFSFESLVKAVDGCCVQVFQENEDVVCMGDKADTLFILVAGRASVSQTEQDGRETKLREMHPGETVGEFSLLCGDPFPVSVTAVEDVVIVKVPLGAMSPVFRNEPNKSADCVLYHKAIEYHKYDAEREEEQKDIVWGSKEWNKLRSIENESLLKRVEQLCHVHVFQHDQTNSARTRVQTISEKMNDDGNSVYAYAKDASYVNLNVTVDFVPHQEVSTRIEESDQDHQDDNADPGVAKDVSKKEDTERHDQDSSSELSTKGGEKKRDQPEKNAKAGDGEASGGSVKLPPNPRMKMRMQFFCNDRVEPFRFVDLSSDDGVTCAPGSVCMLQNAMLAQVEHYSRFALSSYVSGGRFCLLTKMSTTGSPCAKSQMPRSRTNTPLQCSEAAPLPSPISLCSRLPRVCDFAFRRIHVTYVAATCGCVGCLHVYRNEKQNGCSLTISQQVSCST